jgi:hypothetical protein
MYGSTAPSNWEEQICIYCPFVYRLCGLVVRVPGYRSGGPGFYSRALQEKKVVGQKRGPLSLVSTAEELLGINRSCSGLESREYGRRDSSRLPCGTLYPQNVGTNFVDKRRSLGRCTSFADWGHGVFFIFIDPSFLELDTSSTWVGNFNWRPLHRRGSCPRYPLDRRQGRPQSRSGGHGEERILEPAGTQNPTPRSSSPYPIATPTALSLLLCVVRCIFARLRTVRRTWKIQFTSQIVHEIILVWRLRVYGLNIKLLHVTYMEHHNIISAFDYPIFTPRPALYSSLQTAANLFALFASYSFLGLLIDPEGPPIRSVLLLLLYFYKFTRGEDRISHEL